MLAYFLEKARIREVAELPNMADEKAVQQDGAV